MADNTKFIKGDPWIPITKKVSEHKSDKRKKSPVLVAIAYISDHADELLPNLGKGDIVVCDASESSIKGGITSAKILLKWKNAGVRIICYENLHAKVVVIGKTAFVGSANASKSSVDDLHEAALQTVETLVVKGIKEFIHDAAERGTSLSKASLKKLKEIKVVRKGSASSKKNIWPPEKIGSLWLSHVFDFEPTDSQEAKAEKDKKGVQVDAKKSGKGYSTEYMYWEKKSNRPELGDWLVGFHTHDEVDDILELSRARIGKVLSYSSPRGKDYILWFLEPNDAKLLTMQDLDSKKLEMLAKDYKKSDKGQLPIKGPATKLYIDLFS